MNVQLQKFALSVAGVFGAAYVACATVVVTAPGLATTLFGWVFHLMNAEPLRFGVTTWAFVGGLVQVALYSYVMAWAAGALGLHFLATGASTGEVDR